MAYVLVVFQQQQQRVKCRRNNIKKGVQNDETWGIFITCYAFL